VIANLSHDTNKLSVFTEGIDGHSLGATYYFPERVMEIIGPYTDNKLAAILLKAEVDAGNKAAKSVRQDGKPVTFGLSYGSFPQKVASTIGCSIEEATSIFNAYHNEMYPQITKWRDTVNHKAKQQGYIEMGLGAKIIVDNPDKDARTTFNSQSQFWSILTLIALAKMHYRIEQAGMQDKVLITNTIYDAIYMEVLEDLPTIKWANEALVDCMNVDFLKDQTVPNDAECELSTNLSNPIVLSKKATLEEIEQTINKLKE
jgi:hypothetical protein